MTGTSQTEVGASAGVLVSGVKPSGEPHLGNLAGMMLPAADLTTRAESYLFVADLHALTTMHSPTALRRHVHDVVAGLLAAGVDPTRAVLFRQSDVPEILELAWILACLAPVGMLERAHAYKAARSEGRPPSLGLLTYPVLMAADVLAFRGDGVAVGPDQEQHVEIARDLARRFNQTFGDTFPLPQPVRTAGASASLPGLDGRKMSKRYGNTLPLGATDDERRGLVRKIVTDSSPAGAPKDPDGAPVVELYRAFASPAEVARLEDRLRRGEADWLEAKNALADVLEREIGPVQRRFAELRRDEAGLESVLAEGAARARRRARETMATVRRRTGLGAQPLRPGDADAVAEALTSSPASDPTTCAATGAADGQPEPPRMTPE